MHHSGPLALIIPVHKADKMQDIRIDNSTHWNKILWNSLQSAYGSAPYFEHYADDYHALLHQSHRWLCEFSLEALELLCGHLGLPKRWTVWTGRSVMEAKETLVDCRKWAIAHKKQQILRPWVYQEQPYIQVFNLPFVGNLSCVDVLFNAQPQVMDIISNSLGLRS